MLKDIAETIKGVVQIVASLLQVGMLALLVWGGWKAYRAVNDYLSKPVELPSVSLPEIQLPSFGKKEPEPPAWKYDHDPKTTWQFGPE
jgi:hypothetical protein